MSASTDRSRFGLMGGLAFGSMGTFSMMGPAVRGYVRGALAGTPMAARLDAEVSRTSYELGQGQFGYSIRTTDMRILAGAEFGVPVGDIAEVVVVGSAGVSRSRFAVGMNQGISNDEVWEFARDVGIGIKFGRHLIGAFHFFSNTSAPYRLLVGARL